MIIIPEQHNDAPIIDMKLNVLQMNNLKSDNPLISTSKKVQ